MNHLPNGRFDPVGEVDLPASRRAARDSLLLSGRLRIEGSAAAADVRIRNLSPGGLMAEHPQPLPNGTAVEVEVRGIGWVSGRVAWSAEGRIGIAFDRQIDPMAARKPVGMRKSGPSAPGFRFPR